MKPITKPKGKKTEKKNFHRSKESKISYLDIQTMPTNSPTFVNFGKNIGQSTYLFLTPVINFTDNGIFRTSAVSKILVSFKLGSCTSALRCTWTGLEITLRLFCCVTKMTDKNLSRNLRISTF
jgi:hypothetical protein